MNLDRPTAPAPYSLLPEVPSFQVTSPDFENGSELDELFAGSGGDISPELEWSGFPPETKSFLVNCFDPDAPTPAGFWHWTVLDVPVGVTTFESNSGDSDATLPGGFHARADNGKYSYCGPYPPEGDRPHRYYFAVHALDVESLGLDAEASATLVAINALRHTVGRAVICGTYQR